MLCLFYRIGFLFLVLVLGTAPISVWAQCENASVALPDFTQSVPNPSNLYCVDFTVDPEVTGHPTGVSMHLQHSYQGDISIRVFACGNTLMLVTRPGGGNCNGGSPFGNSGNVNGTFTFEDFGPNPDNGLAFSGGEYGLSGDPCNVNTVNSFLEMGDACGNQPYTFTICIGDHALADVGLAGDIFPIFYMMPVCGCTDPAASNYEPEANLDDGSCEYPPCELSSTVDLIQPTCLNPFGIAVINTEGGTGEYFYNWNPDVSSDPIGDELQAGWYTVEISDSEDPDCITTIAFEIHPPEYLELSTDVIHTSCQLSNGSVFVFPQGVGPYIYLWSGPDLISGNGSENLSPGIYTVIVTDDFSGCEAFAEIQILDSPPLSLTVDKENANCDGSPGSATVFCEGGSGDYLFDWSPPVSNSNSAHDLAPGTYTVVVSDASIQDCSATIEFNIESEGSLEIFHKLENTTCGLSNGSISLSTNSENPVNYEWRGPSGATGSYADQLDAGIYRITAYDPATGCEGVAVIEVLPSEPLMAVEFIEHPECGEENGFIQIFAQGGSGNYVFEWDPDISGGPEAQNLGSGVYGITIFDQQDPECLAELWVELFPIGEIEVEFTAYPSTCGLDNGSIELFTPTGSGPYDFEWSGPTDASGTHAENLKAGIYQIFISDPNTDCVGLLVIEVEPFEAPELLSEITNAECGGEGGTAQLNISGAPGQYEFYWTPDVSNTDHASDLDPGTYHVQAVDYQTGCFAEINFEIFTEGELGVDAEIIDPSCEGSDGAISLILPGNDNFTLEWSGPVDVAGTHPLNLPPGSYSVTVTKEDGSCNEIVSLELATPKSFEIDYEIIPTSCGLNNGGISVVIDTPGLYHFDWSDENLPSSTELSNLSPGIYELLVKDTITGCEQSAEVEIPASQPMQVMVEEKCLSSGTEYFLAGIILNGNAPYDIVSGDIDLYFSGDSIFSSPFPSGQTYRFEISDSQGCVTDLSEGVRDCDCITQAGILPQEVLEVCKDQIVGARILTESANSSGSDAFEYILFESADDPLNTILIYSSTGDFSFDSTLVELYNYYYIAHVGSEDDGSGRPNYSAGCLDIGSHQKARWLPYSEIEIKEVEFYCDLSLSVPIPGVYDELQWRLYDGPGTIQNSSFEDGYFILEVTEPGLYSVEFTAGFGGLCSNVFIQDFGFHTSLALVGEPDLICVDESDNYRVILQLHGGSGEYRLLPSSTVSGFFSDNKFSSDELPSATPFELHLTDIQNCDTLVVTGVWDCDCHGRPGKIEGELIELCYGEPAEFFYRDDDQVIGMQDSLIFVLYTSINGESGEAILWSGIPIFEMPEEILPGQIYYAGASVVPLSPSGYPLWDSECHSRSNLIQLIWYRMPEINVSFTGTLNCSMPEGPLTVVFETNEQTGPLSFVWSTVHGRIAGSENQREWLINNGGWYFVEIANTSGCSTLDSTLVPEDFSAPENLIIGQIDPACYGDANGSIWIDSVSGSAGPYLFSFNGSEYTETDVWTELPTGIYQIGVKAANGCDSSTQILLQEPDLLELSLGSDTVADRGEEFLVWSSIQPFDPLITYHKWSFDGEILSNSAVESVNFTPGSSGMLGLEVVNENGCVASDSIWIELRENYSVYIPNAFSPNDDGVNDVFRPYFPPSVNRIVEFSIFSRWGTLVYNRKNISPDDSGLGWDGFFKEKKLDSGVFLYVVDIEFTDQSRRRFIGDLLLL